MQGTVSNRSAKLFKNPSFEGLTFYYHFSITPLKDVKESNLPVSNIEYYVIIFDYFILTEKDSLLNPIFKSSKKITKSFTDLRLFRLKRLSFIAKSPGLEEKVQVSVDKKTNCVIPVHNRASVSVSNNYSRAIISNKNFSMARLSVLPMLCVQQSNNFRRAACDKE